MNASSDWPRVVDAELQARLASARIVVVEGPKACGKAFTSRQVAKSEVLLDIAGRPGDERRSANPS